ncbi:hypothetical protein H9633_01600 [Microbacterium sp. Re1]|uniref:LGFP repeat-containing protein n=1 Tax=Microbacterium commune TaxID=2762219 RepID=A0ABR8W1T4_9MICO|nr:hypothetical protein [Microbacterium commune]MBD8010992.1 hypothetical protein [Microbacterium commune]
MHPKISVSRRLATILVTACLAIGSLVSAPEAALAAAPQVAAGTAKSANLSTFTPGNIIADSVFFNSSAMNATQMDAFFKSKVKSCQSGYVCLKDYRQNTPNRPADRYCNGYSGAANESAATIIYRVSLSCGINPRVLIVMLEKEQSLVTHTWPSSWRYDMALGQGCPDTAPCDPAYSGFFYQIYGAARQMQIYAEGRWFTYYAPGKTWNIRYHPNTSCGSSPVRVENTATAALYYYTPYQPNRAALNAGYGTGDACSSYGNRNFFQLFSDWFGDPRNGLTVSGAIADVWTAHGAGTGWIGTPVRNMRSWPAGAGWSQQFVNADIFVKAGQPGRTVTGPIRTEYRLVGEATSGLGWPTGDRIAITGGAYQDFENGRVYERSDGRAFAIAAPMFRLHESVGNVFGAYGWPTSRAYAVPGGSTQTFDRGAAYESASGVFLLDAPWTTWLNSAGGTGGAYGIPTSGITDAGDQTQRVLLSKAAAFRKAGAVTVVKTPFVSVYAEQGYESGALGRPTSSASEIPGGSSQQFTSGQIYSSSAGTFAVTGFASAVAAAGGVEKTGFPTGPVVASKTASSQRFSALTFTKGAAGARSVRGAIKTAYDGTGGASSFLGAATAAERALADGFVQEFDGGRIICAPTALVALPRSMTTAWDSLGGQAGRLGWPVGSSVVTDGVTEQAFQGGLLVSPKTGGAHAIVGATLNAFRIAGGVPVLGAPLEPEQKSAAGYSQRFERGVVFVPYSGSASAVALDTFKEYERGGGLPGFGFATGPAAPVGVGKAQPFQLGSIATSGWGTAAVRGTTWRVFQSSGGYTGPLSYPIESEAKVGNGYIQPFVGGTTYVSPYALAVTRGVLQREYWNRGGPEGALGWPLLNETSGNGVWQQKFQNGTIYLYADGRVVVR